MINLLNYSPDSNGYYGDFGGAFIPEMLQCAVAELRNNYLRIIQSKSFQSEFNKLLKQYVGRPSPLYLSDFLSQKHRCKVYLKREDLNHTGSHKINNSIGQLLLAKALNKKRIIAETGAGQHGVAVATICALVGIECLIYMGEKDIKRQWSNVAKMKLLGAKVIPATCGSKTLKDATNEAIRDWINNPNSYYLIGSVVGPHPYPDIVARLQSVISQELKWQLEENEGKSEPNYIVACIGGGSNAIGSFYHYLENNNVELIVVEAAGLGVKTDKTASTINNGTIGVLHGSKTLVMQDLYGQIKEPHSISAGLDYPGIGPLLSFLYHKGRIKVLTSTDREAIVQFKQMAKNEGILPALESSHALASLNYLHFNSDDIVVVSLSGRGEKDINVLNDYFQYV